MMSLYRVPGKQCTYLVIVKDLLKDLCHWLGGLIEESLHIPQLLVSKIIVDVNFKKVTQLWFQHNSNALPLLWASCTYREMQRESNTWIDRRNRSAASTKVQG